MFNLRNLSPTLQLLAFTCIAFVSLALFMGAGSGLMNLFYGVDILGQPEILDDLDNPDVPVITHWLMVFQHLGFFILPALIFPTLLKYKRSDFFGLHHKATPSFIGLGILAMILVFPLANFIIWLNANISFPESMAAIEASMQELEETAANKFVMMQQGGVGTLLLNVVIVGIIPALGEELVFRGVVQKLITRRSKNIHIGIWASAFFFSLMHFQFYGFFPRMLYGALFGYLLIWSGTIWLPIIAHFFNNVSTLVLQYIIVNQDSLTGVDNAGAGGEYWLVGLSAILFIGVVVLFRRRSKWRTIEYEYLHF